LVSSSKKDRSVVTLEFEPGRDMDLAALEVREKFLRVKPKLPPEIERPIIARYEEADAPILIAALTSDTLTPEDLRRLVDATLKEKVMRVDGVANVEVGGGRERKIVVNLDRQRLAALALPIKRVSAVLERNNLILRSGDVTGSPTLLLGVRTLGAFQTVQDIRKMTIAVSPNGGRVRLEDVAEVTDSFLESESYSRLNARAAVTLYVQKETTANTVRAAGRVLDVLNEFRKDLPAGVELSVISNQRTSILDAVNSVKMTLLIGVALVVLVLPIFLGKTRGTRWASGGLLFFLMAGVVVTGFLGGSQNVLAVPALLVSLTAVGLAFRRPDMRTALVVALSIPASVLVTLVFMYAESVSLNVMSLSGLLLGIGLLVDNAVVVIENYDRLMAEDPTRSQSQAMALATDEMVTPIVSGTLATVVVFLPFSLLQKQTQLLFSGIAFTVTVSLFSSLFVSLTLIPALGSRINPLAFKLSGLDRWVDNLILWIHEKIVVPVKTRTQSVFVLFAKTETQSTPVIPAKAGIQPCTRQNGCREKGKTSLLSLRFVIPAKAGIYWFLMFLTEARWKFFPFLERTFYRLPRNSSQKHQKILDPGLRRDDEPNKEERVLSFLICFFLMGVLLVKLFLTSSWWGAVQSVSAVVFVATGLVMARHYGPSLKWCLAHRRAVLGTVGGLFVLALAVFLFVLPRDFMSASEQSEFVVFVELDTGVRLDISNRVVQEVEKTVRDLPSIKGAVKHVSSRVEGWSSKVYVTLNDRSTRSLTTRQVIAEVRPAVTKVLEAYEKEYKAFCYFSEPMAGKELFVELFGHDYDLLAQLAMDIAGRLGKLPMLSDVKIRYRPGRPQLSVTVEPQRAALFGLDTQEISEQLHAQTRGLRASTFYDKAQEVETVVRLNPAQRETVAQLKNLIVSSPTGEQVFVENTATVRADLSPSEIWHRNRSRVIQVSANLGSSSLETAAKAVKGVLAGVSFPTDYYADIGGQYEEMVQSNRDFWKALVLTIYLIFMVLACQFESVPRPLVIMAAVPLSVIGAVAVLVLWGTTVTMGVSVGLLMLGGIVVNHSIMLLDRILVLKAQGGWPDERERMVEAGRQRLRPIFMTTATTVLGLLPMALDKSESASLWAPLALTVIGGLISSTVLTLFITPVAHLSLSKIMSRFQNYF